MPTIHNFEQAQDALRPYYQNATKLHNLETMERIMAFLGNPQEAIKVLHVAGTSGKTSTAYYCAALLAAQGLTVGLTVSPHVDNLNERLQINGQPLPEAEYCQLLGDFMDRLADCDVKPSYFELLTAMAYYEYARRSVDYAVMEVGMGGQLDATNVINRADKVCLITDIGYDHTHILGNTLASIAWYKAGIIHNKNAVFMYEQSQEVMDVVIAAVDDHKADLHSLRDDQAVELPYLPLFQRRNLGLAAAAVDYVSQRDGRIPPSAAELATAAYVTVPARMEHFIIDGKTVIIDGSHNQQKLHALLTSITEAYPGQAIAAVVGFVQAQDIRWQDSLRELLPQLSYTIFTNFAGEQDYQRSSVDVSELQAFAQEQGYDQIISEPSVMQSLELLLTRPEPVLLMTGSFYLMHHVRQLLKERA